MRPVALVLIPLALLGCDAQLTSKSIDTPRGTVAYKENVTPNAKFAPVLRDLSSLEVSRMRESAAKAPAFIAKYVPSTRQEKDLLDNLDQAFAAWLNSSDPRKESALEIERIVGSAFGQYCVERLPLRWVIASDDNGPEYMIIGDKPQVWSYPLAAVRYRIEDRKTDFIGALYEALVHFHQRAAARPLGTNDNATSHRR